MSFKQDWERIEGLAYGTITERDAERLGPIMADNAHEIVRLVNMALKQTKLLAVVEAAKALMTNEDYRWNKTEDCRVSMCMTPWDEKHMELDEALAALEERPDSTKEDV